MKAKEKENLVNGLIENYGWTEDDREFLSELSDERLTLVHNQAKVAVANGVAESDGGDNEEEDNQEDERGTDSGGKGPGVKGKGAKPAKVANADAADEEDDDQDEEDEKAAAAKAKKGKMAKNAAPDADVAAYIASAPRGVRELLQNGLEAVNAQKQRLIDIITSNAANTFTDKQLAAKPIAELRSLAALAASQGDNEAVDSSGASFFAGQGETAPVGNEQGGPEVLGLPEMSFKKD